MLKCLIRPIQATKNGESAAKIDEDGNLAQDRSPAVGLIPVPESIPSFKKPKSLISVLIRLAPQGYNLTHQLGSFQGPYNSGVKKVRLYREYTTDQGAAQFHR